MKKNRSEMVTRFWKHAIYSIVLFSLLQYSHDQMQVLKPVQKCNMLHKTINTVCPNGF